MMSEPSTATICTLRGPKGASFGITQLRRPPRRRYAFAPVESSPTRSRSNSGWISNVNGDDAQPPICPVCGVTMVPAALSASEKTDGDWVCLECEETGEA